MPLVERYMRSVWFTCVVSHDKWLQSQAVTEKEIKEVAESLV